MSLLFISDLHLDAGDAGAIRRFTTFLDRDAARVRELFILGDLFEAWIGDDDDDERIAPVVTALRRLSAAGVACAVMHGNRDFLLGERFCAQTGCRLLGDFELIERFGQRALLTHGDLLCTDDARYLQLRSELRAAAWRRDFLAKPLGERRRIANELRQMSASEIAMKPADIMDVNQSAVASAMNESGVALLIHGHTHRPALHRFELGDRAAVRLVLGAWHGTASIARWDDGGLRLEQVA